MDFCIYVCSYVCLSDSSEFANKILVLSFVIYDFILSTLFLLFSYLSIKFIMWLEKLSYSLY